MNLSKGFPAVLAAALVLGIGCEKTEETTIVNQVTPIRIALFADTDYVEYDMSDPGCEGSNLHASLEALGHRVLPFSGIDAATFSWALQDKDTLVLPEMEVADLDDDLSTETRSVLALFVSRGGTLVVCSDQFIDLLNNTFGLSLSKGKSSAPYVRNQVGAAGTPFAISPEVLPENDGMSGLFTPSLPAGARVIYEEKYGDSVVAVLPYGNGRIVFLGWGWYDAYPIGAQDGGWNLVLNRALSW